MRRSALVTGGAGGLGSELVPALLAAGWQVDAPSRRQLDITDGAAVSQAVAALAPDVVVNLAAWTDMDRCQADPVGARRVNADAVGLLAEAANRVGARVCQLSTDYVFSGDLGRPYRETDLPGPVLEYGATKLEGEQAAGDGALVVRTAWLSGVHGRNPVKTILRQAMASGELAYVDDRRGSPTVVADLVPVLVDLLDETATGVFHVANTGSASWFELARHVLLDAGQDPERVRPITTEQLDPPQRTPRPVDTTLGCVRLRVAGRSEPGPWSEAVEALVGRLLGEEAR